MQIPGSLSAKPNGELPPPAATEMPQRPELANIVTHAIGCLLSIAAGGILITRSVIYGDAWRVTGCVVFSAALVAVYAVSTLSHWAKHARFRHWMRTLDQALIYVLIAASYTPFGLAYLRSGWWWLFLGVMWAGALGGFVSKLFFFHQIDAVSVWSYILLGWMPMIPAVLGIGLVPLPALGWLLAGGLFYTLGTVFLILDLQRYHFHAVWHLWVIAGSTCHFLSVLLFVSYLPVK